MNSTVNLETVAVKNGCMHHKRCFSWSAVIVGAFVGLGISFLLNLFGIAIGLTAFTTAPDATQTIATGGVIASVIIAIVSMGTLGWVAGYLGAGKRLCYHHSAVCNHGCIYGFTAWSLALLLTIVLAIPTARFLTFNLHNLNPTLVMEPVAKQLNHEVDQQATTVHVSKTNTNVVVSTDTTKTLATTAFLAFALFFIGALAATFAGHLGFRYYSEYERVE